MASRSYSTQHDASFRQGHGAHERELFLTFCVTVGEFRVVKGVTASLAEGTNEALCKKDGITKDEIEFINRVVRPINLDAAEDE